MLIYFISRKSATQDSGLKTAINLRQLDLLLYIMTGSVFTMAYGNICDMLSVLYIYMYHDRQRRY